MKPLSKAERKALVKYWAAAYGDDNISTDTYDDWWRWIWDYK